MQLKYDSINTKNQMKAMPLTVAYHGRSTTSHVQWSVLGAPYTKFMGYPPKV